MSFAMVLAQRPRSANAAPSEGYRDRLRARATAGMAGSTPLEGPLYVRIIWFHTVPTTGDVDNIAKRIVDALVGVVFADDGEVVQVLSTRVDLRLKPVFVFPSLPNQIRPRVEEELTSLVSSSEDHILYVEVGMADTQQVVFGSVDGGPA